MNSFASQAHCLDRFTHTEMTLVGLVEDKGGMRSLHAFFAHIPAVYGCCPIARGLETGEIGLGTSTHKHSRTPLDRKTGQFHHPAYRAMLQYLSGMIANAAVGIHRRRQRLQQDTGMGRGRVNPTGEAWMAISLRIRQHHRLEKG